MVPIRSIVLAVSGAWLGLLACTDDAVELPEGEATQAGSSESGDGDGDPATETGASGTETGAENGTETGQDELPPVVERPVRVTLDGEPVAGAIVIQGGTGVLQYTDEQGELLAKIDTAIPGELVLIASHPEARSAAELYYPQQLLDGGESLFELLRYELGDNEDYEFSPPGVPEIDGTTAQCGHCHKALKNQWHASPHRASASNPAVQDIYAGAAAAYGAQASCEAAGGQWWAGLEPGTGEATTRCYLGAGTLPDLNPGCGLDSSCDGVATEFGACADCHAPAIDGVVGGRDLLDATGAAYEGGVHCDLCHKVDQIELDAPAGVAGRLQLARPFEPPLSPGTGNWWPLSFGPYADVPNPRMGASPREHFLHAEFCAGCHQHDQPVLVPGAQLDPARWPAGSLPVHSTYEEWNEGPFGGVAPCSSCHMPADAAAGNGADLLPEDIPLQGIARGWWRPPGAVREHTWVGPRTPDSGMLQLAAALLVDKQLTLDELTVTVRVRNVGAGHAIPTGEPLRSLILVVSARCGDDRLPASGGDVVPEFGGWLDRKLQPEDWSSWPGAEVGDVLRVLVDEGWHDYEGFGPFGDGSFDPAQKGLPQLRLVQEVRITGVDGDSVTLEEPLAAGDIVYRGRPDPFVAADPLRAEALAGAPGFGFARVLVDEQGERMVPHHAAVDVASDNRLLPQEEWASTHVFESSCPDPIVEARLLHRAYPVELAAERGWEATQQLMAEVVL